MMKVGSFHVKVLKGEAPRLFLQKAKISPAIFAKAKMAQRF